MSVSVKRVDIERGFSWITEAWPYFTSNPTAWIGAILALFGISIVAGFVPFGLGSVTLNTLYPVFTGGFMLGCMAYKQGDSFEFQHMFSGFSSPYFNRLLAVGLINLMCLIIILCLVGFSAFFFFGQELSNAFQENNSELLNNHLLEFLLIWLILLALLIPLAMCVWFAPAVIIISEKTSALEAMKKSFIACLKNILPFLIYGIFSGILLFIATIPLMLGYLVLLPVLTASLLIASQDCFQIDITDEPTLKLS